MDQRLGSIVTSVPDVVLHLGTVGDGVADEALAKSDKYLTWSDFLRSWAACGVGSRLYGLC